MESAFINLTRGSRLTAFLGLEMAPGHTYTFGPNYQYVEIPLSHFLKDDGSTLDEAKPNQHLEVIPGCSIQVKGHYPAMIHYNPALQAVATLGSSHMVWPGEMGRHAPGYFVTFRKGIKVGDVTWAVRISLVA
jgi:hypothetical protein